MFGKANQSKKSATLALRKPLRFLGYGLPRGRNDDKAKFINGDGFVIQDVPLGSPVSFLDSDGLIIFAGAFDGVRRGHFDDQMICRAPADLDRREREFFTAIKQGIPIVFIVPDICETQEYQEADKFDLFRRIVRRFNIRWGKGREPNPHLESNAPEFREYVSRYGTGYIYFSYRKDENGITTLCGNGDEHYGIILGRNVFVLPCTQPDSVEKGHAASRAAVDAVIRYRRRLSNELPEWALSFTFGFEADLLTEANSKRAELTALDAKIESYASYKGALVCQSDPLVEAVRGLFDHFLGITLTVDDKCVEDALLRAEDGHIEAVFEIKGVKGDFKRNNINQMDSHRERLGVPAETPGILIMNTFMEAESLKEKDQSPHPDIIKKSVDDHVLMIRTLDLLRFADAVERGAIKADEMRRLILNEVGWLKAVKDSYEVVKH